MTVLGLESSCDETSVSIIRDDKILANLISSQHFHLKYGGVVPELSSRAHLQMITPLFKEALIKAKIPKEEIDVVSATAGPGLIGALLVGLNFGKALSYSLNKPFVAVNHIEGHIFSGFLMKDKPEFPILTLVVSGGHTLLLLVKDDLNIVKLGTTIDDAAGEAFDKVAKMIGLGYPGGPKVQEYAQKGNANAIKFPIANLKGDYDYSFSGLKTSVLRYVQKEYVNSENIPENDKSDIAASFQNAVVKALSQNVEKAIIQYNVKTLSLVGGVAANMAIREKISELAWKYNKKLVIPDIEFCGDNAAMIAYRASKLFENNIVSGLTANAFPSLPKDAFQSIEI
ncbi:MAG: tRNA (adenosine(37)-N6)-threonylcarbamoyltransferase complex transferase subunit TsaD [Bacteroidetes bacterium]|nr:tRNA (adenosine(37)-N6)-threonylcarbamoyltransferase complex transferase subunit TsaD [Bacteroidota bacterium]MBU1115277.1 tRNA (adenosine(37)-N6)-threonylcarbamoyltransferase complex transferase subunit TsaD [Bacteroidota bacterium]MBU1799242.1 tRNA (adenosine(37)-N6)-threonylcarbamoyltransferase complex transferase subunit TsaD [Bacteroidota bacterium]